MRKYQQLLLVLVSFVSVTSLLLYRYEYMQLLNVLEVLNFFGYTADNMTKCILLEDKFYVDMENDNLLAKAPVSWIKRDQYYAYSAFWSAQQQSVHLQILGPSTAFSGYECRVWFKIADQFVSKTAKLSYNIKTNNRDPNFHQYEIHCKPDVPVDTEPYGVLLGRDNSLKLFIPITIQKEYPIKDDLIVCIAPDYSGIPDTYLVEFIAYYTLLGVRHFVVYDIGIHYQVIEFLRSIAGHNDLYKTFSTLSWQFPSTDLPLEKSILQKDCLQRTQGLAKHSILLSWDQYLMLNKNEGLSSLKNDIEYTFEVKKCCNNRQLKKSLPMALKKTICERTNETVNTIINDQTINYQSPTKMGSIHRLEEVCEKIYGEDDKNMAAKYLINFVHSKLLSLWKSQLKLSITRAKNNNVINL